jgi:two-component system, chemotaxis family, chemotaxis protein CheY
MIRAGTNFLSRILIVDDDMALRTMLGLMLTGEGYDISQAGNGEQAIALFRRRPFDLVITELNLEGKDGFQIIAELRREPFRASFIGLVRTGWMPADFCLRMAEDLGAHSVLVKPFAPEQLLAAVRGVLNEN